MKPIIVKKLYGDGKTNCTTCGIVLGVSKQTQCTYCLGKGVQLKINTLDVGVMPVVQSRKKSQPKTKQKPEIKMCLNCPTLLANNRLKRCPECKEKHKISYNKSYNKNYRLAQIPRVKHCCDCPTQLDNTRHKRCPECKEKHRNRNRAFFDVVCVYSKCGKVFKTHRGNVKTCSKECSMLRAIERDTHAYRHRKQTIRTTP